MAHCTAQGRFNPNIMRYMITASPNDMDQAGTITSTAAVLASQKERKAIQSAAKRQVGMYQAPGGGGSTGDHGMPPLIFH